MTPEPWRAEYARRFVARALLRPPWPPVVYVRLTDEQIAALPENQRVVARFKRDLLDAMTALAENVSRGGATLPPCGCKTECFHKVNPWLPVQRECREQAGEDD